MMKKTSKITLLSAMLLAGVVNAQEFYTCVPKKSWWGDVIKSNVPSASDIANAIPKPQAPTSNWRLIKIIEKVENVNLTLEPGKYKFILKIKNEIKQNILNIPFTSSLGFVGYSTYCSDRSRKDTLLNFLNNYDKKNLLYLERYNFEYCGKDNCAGVYVLVVGNIALFAYEDTCDWLFYFKEATLEIYKKSDD